MTQSKFRTTVSCHQRQPITVGDEWFLAEDVITSDGTREVCVVTRHRNVKRFLQGKFLPQGARYEIFPEVFVTFTDLAKKSKVRLLIEASEGVPIAMGYPRQMKAAA